MDLMQEMLPRVKAYLDARDWKDIPMMRERQFQVAPLAQGEYNLNYLIRADSLRLVFRVNIGTQIARDDQILYEYRTLELLKDSGVTPRPYFVDDSRTFFERGVLIMEFLPGEPLDYTRDLQAAADLFATIHQVGVTEEQNHLIREDAPLSLIYEECAGLVQHYLDSDLAEPALRAYLQELIDWAATARGTEKYYQADPWPCIVNTEVNSGNFVVNREENTVHLVDWEMPRWGDPSQDLSHFCSPLTTLWKTNWRMSAADKRDFLATYRQGIQNRHLRDTLAERVRLRDPFVYLRGISWSAMGWVAYQTEFAGMKNPDTWATLQRYMNLDFVRSLFDPFMAR
ncbi:MAG: phosphotransferase [Desulfobacterales bacterium]|nr:MAG: phosphotransferase [Desulfobacterales bacterium]